MYESIASTTTCHLFKKWIWIIVWLHHQKQGDQEALSPSKIAEQFTRYTQKRGMRIITLNNIALNTHLILFHDRCGRAFRWIFPLQLCKDVSILVRVSGGYRFRAFYSIPFLVSLSFCVCLSFLSLFVLVVAIDFSSCKWEHFILFHF